MKTLVLVRHAKSSHDNGNDIERTLNERGQAEAEMMSLELNKEKLNIKKIISSPAIRAISTALVFAPRIAVKYENVIINKNLYECGEEAILKVIQSTDNHLDQIMLFGHNPDFGRLVNLLVPTKIDNFPTTAIAIITFNLQNWSEINYNKGKLLKLLIPEQYRN
jgi:phosphohistidine phosphatase